MPLAKPPPRDSRFGAPLQLTRLHWVRPEVVVEVTHLTWTEDNLLRQVSYQGQREISQQGKWSARSPWTLRKFALKEATSGAASEGCRPPRGMVRF
jgi:ATP-dependent DNA ligase